MFSLLALYFLTQSLAVEPFWKDAKFLSRVHEQKYIAVKAVTDDSKTPAIMDIDGGALVNAPLDFVFKTCQEYEHLKDVASNFEEVQFYPDKQRLFVHTSALGYHAQMILQIKPVTEEKKRKLEWESVEGSFKGMKGVFVFEEYDHVKTEMSLKTSYEADKLPLPKLLRGIGLEYVTQKVASKMREYLEKRYQESTKANIKASSIKK